MNPRIRNVYFVGAGGIGMAALERWCLANGLKVAGYDRTPTELTDALRREGVDMVFDDDPALIPPAFRDPATTLVVYTPAVPATHRGLQWLRAAGHEVVKRARMLGEVTDGLRALCVAGTHGKTTTSSMAAHVLHEAGPGCNAFIGGVLRNYGSNCLLAPESPLAVAEADEYDRSFHQLRPTVAVITATDPDHLDIYGTEEAYVEAFARFTELVRPGGALLVHTGLKLTPRPVEGVTVHTYGPGGDWRAERVGHTDGRIYFDLAGPDGLLIPRIELGVPVEVNIENAVAALAGALLLCPGLDRDKAARAMATFMGPQRRFEFWLREPGRAIIDDYGHHPREVEASITSVRRLYPGRRLTVAFQPHLYSRTRDFAPEFARALSLADEVVLVDIYPAREEPIPGVTTRTIGDLMAPNVKKAYTSKENLPDLLKKHNFEVLITLGAGDIVDCLPQIVSNARGQQPAGAAHAQL